MSAVQVLKSPNTRLIGRASGAFCCFCRIRRPIVLLLHLNEMIVNYRERSTCCQDTSQFSHSFRWRRSVWDLSCATQQLWPGWKIHWIFRSWVQPINRRAIAFAPLSKNKFTQLIKNSALRVSYWWGLGYHDWIAHTIGMMYSYSEIVLLSIINFWLAFILSECESLPSDFWPLLLMFFSFNWGVDSCRSRLWCVSLDTYFCCVASATKTKETSWTKKWVSIGYLNRMSKE